jgi:succinoglycan biosynthesis protein ExoO
MTTSAPQVSIIIAAWRAAQTLPIAVASALAQTGVEVEVIIVDDASPDDTFAVAQGLAQDNRVRALRMPINGGPSAARNLALSQARAPWIAILDADDQMRPDRISTMMALARERGAAVVLGNLTEVSADPARFAAGQTFITMPNQPVEWDLRTYIRGNLAAANARTLGYLKPMIDRDFLNRHKIRYDESLHNGEDFHLILACFAAGARVWFSPAPDYIYIRGAGSVSHRSDPAHMTALVAADRAYAARLSDSTARRLLQRRVRQLTHLGNAETIISALRDRRPIAALWELLRHPRSVPRLIRQLSQALHKRIYP